MAGFVAEKRKLLERIAELEDAIRAHRLQRLDDRCWMDDQVLYEALHDGDSGDNATPPKEKMLANCERFIDRRCKPGDWRSYQEIEDLLGAVENRMIAYHKGMVGGYSALDQIAWIFLLARLELIAPPKEN